MHPASAVRATATDAQSFLQDLGAWTQEAKRTDAALKRQPAAVRDAPPTRGSAVGRGSPAPPEGGSQPSRGREGSSSAPPQDNSAAAWRERGNEAFRSTPPDYAAAESHYTSSLALCATAAAYANRAMARLKLGRHLGAEADCSAALALEPHHLKALQRRGTARRQLGRLLDAACDFDAAARLEPGSRAALEERRLAVAAYEAEAGLTFGQPPTDIPITPLRQLAIPAQLPATASVDAPAPALPRARGCITEVSGGESWEQMREPGAQAVVTAMEVSPCPPAQPRAPPPEAAPPGTPLSAVAPPPLRAPRSGTEFERAWRSAAGSPEAQLQLLRLLPPASLPAVLRESLSAPVLATVLRAALALLLPQDAPLALSTLRSLTAVPRFNMVLLLLSHKDKADVAAAWDAAESGAHEETRVALRELRTLYKV